MAETTGCWDPYMWLAGYFAQFPELLLPFRKLTLDLSMGCCSRS